MQRSRLWLWHHLPRFCKSRRPYQPHSLALQAGALRHPWEDDKVVDGIPTGQTTESGVTADSSWKAIVSGVPQGALLSPILFLIFVNDLPTVVESTAKLFDDDTERYRAISDENDTRKLQQDLNRLAAWSKTWCMSFNA